MQANHIPFRSQYGVEISTVYATDPGFTETGGIITTDSSVFNGGFIVHGSISIEHDVSVSDNISVLGNASFNGDIDVQGLLNANIINAVSALNVPTISASDIQASTITITGSSSFQDITAISLDVPTITSQDITASALSIANAASIAEINTTNLNVTGNTIVDAFISNSIATQSINTNSITTDSINSTDAIFSTLNVNTSFNVNTDKFTVSSLGNVGISGSLIITGNLTVNGTTTTINTTNLSINDPLIYLATGNSSNANDIGIVGHFNDGTYQHTGLVRDASDGIWKLFTHNATEPSGTIDFSTTNYAPLKIGALTASNTTIDSLTVTGIAALGSLSTTTISATTITANSLSDSLGDIRLVPRNLQTTQYTLTQADSGKHISITSGGIIVPANTLSIGTTITIFNNSGFSQAIVQSSGVTMYMAGASSETTGSRTLTLRGLVTLICVDTNTFVISGAGLL